MCVHICMHALRGGGPQRKLVYLSLAFYSHFLQGSLVDELWEIVSLVLIFLGFSVNCLSFFHLQMDFLVHYRNLCHLFLPCLVGVKIREQDVGEKE